GRLHALARRTPPCWARGVPANRAAAAAESVDGARRNDRHGACRAPPELSSPRACQSRPAPRAAPHLLPRRPRIGRPVSANVAAAWSATGAGPPSSCGRFVRSCRPPPRLLLSFSLVSFSASEAELACP